MKILYLSQHPTINLTDPSGPGTHIREMINAFRKTGNEVLPVIFGGTEIKNHFTDLQNNFLKKKIKNIVPVFLWESLKDYFLYQSNKEAGKILSEYVKKFQPDLIYERAGYLQFAGVKASKKHNVKYFVEINAPLTEEKKMLQGKSLFYKKALQVEKEIISWAKKNFVVSSKLKEYYLENFISEKEKIIIMPNAVNPDEIKTDEKLLAEIRNEYKLNGKIVIGFVGSIFKYHGVDILITAFKKISQQKENAVLMVVGGGETLEELKGLAAFLNLSTKIIFTGNVSSSKVFTYISLFDIAVLPKTNEYMSPIKIFEYGAMKKAIIAPDVSSVRDVIKNEEDGLLIHSDEENLSTAIIRLINNENLRTVLGENFSRKIFSEHTWIKNAEKILSFV